MPYMVLNRDYSLRSLAGQVIDFKKGEPTWVAPMITKEALGIGALGVDEQLDVLDASVAEPTIYTAEERLSLLTEAFKELEERNERTDFTAQGVPSTNAIKTIVGFDMSATERDKAWMEYLQAKSDLLT